MVNNIYQARYYMQKLSQSKHLANLEKFVPAIMQSGIEIYPHQIEASLSALDNPFRKGFVLCDEVGLGKGIEAMLVIAQKYYENKKIIVIVPVNLLDQWQDMIVNKFNLNCIIQQADNEQNFENYITLVSIQYAVENEEILKGKVILDTLERKLH